MSVRLRRTTPDDLAFVTALERRPENEGLIGQWTDAEHLAAIARAGNREHFIVELDGARAGYLILYDGRPTSPSVYLKRILIADKERGTGQAAVAAFLKEAFARDGIEWAWLLVREYNARAQAVYRKLGFDRYDPAGDEAASIAAYAEAPGNQSFRMRIDASAWHSRPDSHKEER